MPDACPACDRRLALYPWQRASGTGRPDKSRSDRRSGPHGAPRYRRHDGEASCTILDIHDLEAATTSNILNIRDFEGTATTRNFLNIRDLVATMARHILDVGGLEGTAVTRNVLNIRRCEGTAATRNVLNVRVSA